MAVITWYIAGTAGATPNFFGVLTTSAPAAANAIGWIPSKTALTTPFYRGRLGSTAGATAASATSYIAGTSGPTAGTGTTITTAGDSFISPTALTGTFANANWVVTAVMRCTTANATGRLRMRVWKSTNAAGTSPTELTGSVQVSSPAINLNAKSTDFTTTITWSPGSTFTLTAEYLFFQIEWEETVIGGSSNDDALFRIGSATIVTPNFTQSSSLAVGAGSYAGTGLTIAPAVGVNVPAASHTYTGSAVTLSKAAGLQTYTLPIDAKSYSIAASAIIPGAAIYINPP